LPTAVRISPIGEQADSHIFYPEGALGRDNYSMFGGYGEVEPV
jgi:hypothetical protein